MSANDTIRILLGRGRDGRDELDPAEWKRVAARVAWTRETAAKWREAHRKVEAAWDRILAALPDDISDEELEEMHIPDPPEQAELDALHAQLWAVIDHDKWPKELYFGGI